MKNTLLQYKEEMSNTITWKKLSAMTGLSSTSLIHIGNMDTDEKIEKLPLRTIILFKDILKIDLHSKYKLTK